MTLLSSKSHLLMFTQMLFERLFNFQMMFSVKMRYAVIVSVLLTYAVCCKYTLRAEILASKESHTFWLYYWMRAVYFSYNLGFTQLRKLW